MTERVRVPPLNALRAFEAAARLRSFKHAAAELHVTPTAISHQIKLLEKIVGEPLFERLVRAVVLTDAGHRLYPSLREGFARIAQAAAELRNQRDSLTLSVTTAFASQVLIPCLPRLMASRPQLRLRINATEELADLRTMEADLAIRYAHDRPTPYESTTLFSDRYIAVAAPSLLGQRHSKSLGAVQVAAMPLLAFRWRSSTLRCPGWSEWMVSAGVDDFDETDCNLFSEEVHALQAAVAGLGVALLSEVFVRKELAAGLLRQVHPLAMPGFTFKAMYLPGHSKMAVIRNLVRSLVALTRAERSKAT
jgi:LysR family transcriptional regulator, glycine cleavage system transcriptional activator